MTIFGDKNSNKKAEDWDDVYARIESFSDFRHMSHEEHYTALPSDWSVIVSDIEGSTKAIEAGRYRDVNTVGTSCIAAVRNALKGYDFPYVFGGDGASMVVPPHMLQDAMDALLALRRMVKQNFDMELRVGSLPIREIEAAGSSVLVARYEIVPNMSIALFRGGGLALADTVIKARGTTKETESSLRTEPHLDGLSCRWNKVPNRHGCVLSLLVMANPLVDDGDIYQDVLDEIDRILNPLNDSNPVNVEAATYKTANEMLREEIRLHPSPWTASFAGRACEIFAARVIFGWGLLQHSPLLEDAPAYKQSMRTHADYFKFDDMLRMVIDCTPEQRAAIESMLQEKYTNGRQVYYGVQNSSHSLMTCLLKDTSEGNHIHFIDGDSGGYAMAAKGLKRQLKQDAEKKSGPKSEVVLPSGQVEISIRRASLDQDIPLDKFLAQAAKDEDDGGDNHSSV